MRHQCHWRRSGPVGVEAGPPVLPESSRRPPGPGRDADAARASTGLAFTRAEPVPSFRVSTTRYPLRPPITKFFWGKCPYVTCFRNFHAVHIHYCACYRNFHAVHVRTSPVFEIFTRYISITAPVTEIFRGKFRLRAPPPAFAFDRDLKGCRLSFWREIQLFPRKCLTFSSRGK